MLHIRMMLHFSVLYPPGCLMALSNLLWISAIDKPVRTVIMFFSRGLAHILLILAVYFVCMRTISAQELLECNRSEKELRYLRNYLRNIIDSMPSILIGVDSEDRVIQWNMQVMKNRVSEDMPKNQETADACGTTIETIRAYMEKRGLLNSLDLIIESGKRTGGIVSNMLSFSRKSGSHPFPQNIGELLDRTLNSQ